MYLPLTPGPGLPNSRAAGACICICAWDLETIGAQGSVLPNQGSTFMRDGLLRQVCWVRMLTILKLAKIDT